MYSREYYEALQIEKGIIDLYDLKNTAFFDIETTGFDKDEDKVILISLGYYVDEQHFQIKQYYAESLEEEAEVLYAFGKDLSTFDKWCSYNGIAFDEPFLRRRMERNSIFFEAPAEHVDLYRKIRPYYRQLGMERCNLKTVEKYLGIEREDQIDGGLSVQLYYQYLETSNNGTRDIIMLHNYEDVLNLPKIFKIIYEVDKSPLVRDNLITEKQVKFLKSLLKKHNIRLESDIERISKRSASRIIDLLLKGSCDQEKFDSIIDNSY